MFALFVQDMEVEETKSDNPELRPVEQGRIIETKLFERYILVTVLSIIYSTIL